MALFGNPERRAERQRRKSEKSARRAEKKEVAEAKAKLRVEKAQARLANDKARASLRLQRLQAKLSTTAAREELRVKRDVRIVGARTEKLARTVRGSTWFGGSAKRIDVRAHAEPHQSPSHHIGACDGACRAGQRPHQHRRPQMEAS